MTRGRWMALCFGLGSVVFSDRAVSWLCEPGRRRRGCDHVLRRIDPVHYRRGASELARVARKALVWRGPRGLVVVGDPIGGDPVLQHHHISGDAQRRDRLRVRQAGLATRLAGVDLLPRLGCDRVSRVAAQRMASRRAEGRGGGSRRSTCSGASSSASPQSPATSFRQPARSSTKPPRTGTRRWGPRASWPALSTLCTPTRPRRCPGTGDSANSNTLLSATSRESPDNSRLGRRQSDVGTPRCANTRSSRVMLTVRSIAVPRRVSASQSGSVQGMPSSSTIDRAQRNVALLVAGCFFMEMLDGTIVTPPRRRSRTPCMCRSAASRW